MNFVSISLDERAEIFAVSAVLVENKDGRGRNERCAFFRVKLPDGSWVLNLETGQPYQTRVYSQAVETARKVNTELYQKKTLAALDKAEWVPLEDYREELKKQERIARIYGL